jgi:hypothetical protein
MPIDRTEERTGTCSNGVKRYIEIRIEEEYAHGQEQKRGQGPVQTELND